MKPIILFTLLLITSTTLYGKGDPFVVKTVSGTVIYAGNRKEVKAGQTVTSTDKVTVDANSWIKIVDKNEHVHTYQEKGTVTIKEIANKKNKGILQILIESFRERPSVNKSIYGVTKRSSWEPGIALDIHTAETDERISGLRLPADSDYYFKLINYSDENLYFNLFRRNLAGQVIPLFDQSVDLETMRELTIPEFVFNMPGDEEYTFILCSAPQPMENNKLLPLITENKPITSAYPEASLIWKELLSE